jgi:hypothetical protein
MASDKFTLDMDDVKHLVQNALLVGAAASLAYIGENVSELDLGTTGVLLVPVIMVGIDTLVSWLKGTKKVEDKTA